MAGLGLAGVISFTFGGSLLFRQLLEIVAHSNSTDPNGTFFIGLLGFGFVGLGVWLIHQDKVSKEEPSP